MDGTMREIVLDAGGWVSGEACYDALLGAIGAPSGHGRNANALIDSMIWGGINSLEPPYRIIVKNTKSLPTDAMNALSQACGGLADGREDFRHQEGHDIGVSLEVVA